MTAYSGFEFAMIQTGPSVRDLAAPCDWPLAGVDFINEVRHPEHRRLLEWWIARLLAEGDIPAYDSRWHRDLADIAPTLYSRERLPGTIRIRYRYAGEIPVQRIGFEMSGRWAAELRQTSDDEIWTYNRILMEEQRPVLLSIDYRMIGRGFVKGLMLEVPLRDPGSGETRFVLGAAHYFDPD